MSGGFAFSLGDCHVPPLQPKPNTAKPHIPEGLEVGAKVEILGERGLYLVVRVDEQRYAADLMLMGKTARVEQGVSFNNIRPIAERRGTELSATRTK